MTMKQQYEQATDARQPVIPATVLAGSAPSKAVEPSFSEIRLDKTSDLVGHVVYYPGAHAFPGVVVQGQQQMIKYPDTVFLITNEVEDHTLWGHFLTFPAIKSSNQEPLTLGKVWPRNSMQPIFNPRFASVQTRFGGSVPTGVTLLTDVGVCEDVPNSMVIPHQNIRLSNLNTYQMLHKVFSNFEDNRPFIPICGRQRVSANDLSNSLKNGEAVLCPLDIPGLLTMDMEETKQAVQDATKPYRHPVITSMEMVFSA